MQLSRDLGLVLLGLWLILVGLFGVVSGLSGLGIVLTLLAIATGAVLLLRSSSARARNPGFLLLSIYLIAWGLLRILPIRATGLNTVLDLVALGAGVFLLAGARGRNLSRYPGMLLVSLWLLLSGLAGLTTLGIPGFGLILALLALVAGFFILLGR
jgi:hypothetical protein